MQGAEPQEREVHGGAEVQVNLGVPAVFELGPEDRREEIDIRRCPAVSREPGEEEIRRQGERQPAPRPSRPAFTRLGIGGREPWDFRPAWPGIVRTSRAGHRAMRLEEESGEPAQVAVQRDCAARLVREPDPVADGDGLVHREGGEGPEDLPLRGAPDISRWTREFGVERDDVELQGRLGGEREGRYLGHQVVDRQGREAGCAHRGRRGLRGVGGSGLLVFYASAIDFRYSSSQSFLSFSTSSSFSPFSFENFRMSFTYWSIVGSFLCQNARRSVKKRMAVFSGIPLTAGHRK